MMKEASRKLSLDQPATYQIKVPGYLDRIWVDWSEGITLVVEKDLPFTTLTVTVDQAAFHGLLRHLYSLGLPLISAICVDCG